MLGFRASAPSCRSSSVSRVVQCKTTSFAVRQPINSRTYSNITRSTHSGHSTQHINLASFNWFTTRRTFATDTEGDVAEAGDVAEGQTDFDLRTFVVQSGVSKKYVDEVYNKLKAAGFNESRLDQVNEKYLRNLDIPAQERFAIVKAANDWQQSINYKKKKSGGAATSGAGEKKDDLDDEELGEEEEEEGFRPTRSSRPISYEITQPWDLSRFLDTAAVDKENFDAVFDALKEDGFDDTRLGSLTTRYLKDIKIPNEEIPGILRAAKVWARPLKPGKLNPGYERRSPSESATNYEHGHIRVGNDGQPWVVKISSDGVRRWRPFKVELY